MYFQILTWLQITMRNISAMKTATLKKILSITLLSSPIVQVLQSNANLMHYVGSFPLCEWTVLAVLDPLK